MAECISDEPLDFINKLNEVKVRGFQYKLVRDCKKKSNTWVCDGGKKYSGDCIATGTPVDELIRFSSPSKFDLDLC